MNQLKENYYERSIMMMYFNQFDDICIIRRETVRNSDRK